MKLYIKNNCEFCSQLQIPKDLKIEVINVDLDYTGFHPPQLPMVQTGNKINIAGHETINELLNIINLAKHGKW